jgi:hypothetical protein
MIVRFAFMVGQSNHEGVAPSAGADRSMVRQAHHEAVIFSVPWYDPENE